MNGALLCLMMLLQGFHRMNQHLCIIIIIKAFLFCFFFSFLKLGNLSDPNFYLVEKYENVTIYTYVGTAYVA